MTTPLLINLDLRWGDQDAFGHINNVVFLRLLEEARVRALATWFDGHDLAATPVFVVRHEIEYVAQMEYTIDPVVVAIWVSACGASSYDLSFEVRSGDTVCAVGETTLVRVDPVEARPCRLTEEERAALSVNTGEPARLRRRRTT